MTRPRITRIALLATLLSAATAQALFNDDSTKPPAPESATSDSDATLTSKLDNSLRQHAAATRLKNHATSDDLQQTTLAGVLQALQNGTGLDIHVNWPALQSAGLSPNTQLQIPGQHLSYQQYLAAACKQLHVSLVLYFKEPQGEFTLTTLASCPANIVSPIAPSRPALPQISDTWDYVDSPKDRALRQSLEENLKELLANQQALEKVINFLRDATDLTFNVNWTALQAAGVDRNTLVTVNLHDVPVRKALRTVLAEVGGGTASLDYTVDDGIIQISTRDDLSATRYQVVRTYDVRSLLTFRGDYDLNVRDLIETIQDSVARETWCSAGGTIGRLREYNGTLVITQTRDNHLAIASLLKTLVEDLKPPVPGKIPDGWDLPDSPKNHAVDLRLDQPAAPLVAYSQSLESVINSLRDSSHLNILVDWPRLQGAGIDRTTPINLSLKGVTLRKTIAELLLQADPGNSLNFVLDDGALTISTRDDVNSAKYQEVRVYDIRLLVVTGRGTHDDRVRDLIDVIQTCVAPDTWAAAGGTIGTLRELRGRLIVNQTHNNHIALVRLFKKLAAAQHILIPSN